MEQTKAHFWIARQMEQVFRTRPGVGVRVMSSMSMEIICDVGLMAHSPGAVEGFVTRERLCRAGALLDFPARAGLIFLYLNKEMAACLKGGFEGFFWQCIASTVNSRPSSPNALVIWSGLL